MNATLEDTRMPLTDSHCKELEEKYLLYLWRKDNKLFLTIIATLCCFISFLLGYAGFYVGMQTLAGKGAVQGAEEHRDRAKVAADRAEEFMKINDALQGGVAKAWVHWTPHSGLKKKYNIREVTADDAHPSYLRFKFEQPRKDENYIVIVQGGGLSIENKRDEFIVRADDLGKSSVYAVVFDTE